MDIKNVAEKFNVNEKTVLDWCEKGLIRGLTKSEDGIFEIPSSVRKPYTRSRSTGDAIYTSIVKATLGGFDVTASLYGLSENEFLKYVQQLKDAGVIDSYNDEKTGVEYLCKTLKSDSFAKLRKNKITKFLREVKPNININIGPSIGL